jgi:hypothetical protein
MAKDSSSSFGSSEAMSRLHGTVRKAFTGYYRTSDFIRRVRSCKTASHERALVAKESAAIRDSFKGASVSREQRYHSLAKLVYIYLLGYPTIFGQVECMKMAASISHSVTEPARFKDKRLGYLGVTLMSDEHQETLTLVTNSLKFDLESDSESVQALALSSLSLLASVGMARELATEVAKLLMAPSANIRKKATACATKLIQKDPELFELFEPRLTSLLSDKNHSVQLASLVLFQTILDSNYDGGDYLKLLPSLVKILQSLQTSPLDTEYDISGVSDPLLQIQLLKLIRKLGTSREIDPVVLESLNDLLAQLATTLDTSKNVGNAVLYEVVLTVMALPVDQSLVNLAIGTLGRFLSGNSCGDNNLRYVALNLLTRILTGHGTETTFIQVQKHQSTILACLHDADSTIRKKAADLALLLIKNSTDLVAIAPALLELCKREPKDHQIILDKLAKTIQKYAHDPVIFLKLYISLLKQVDTSHVAKNEIVSQFIKYSSRFDSVLVVRELYFALTILDDNSETVSIQNSDEQLENCDFLSSSALIERPKITLPSESLLEVCFWYFGEFGQIVSLESLCSPTDLINLLAAFTKKRSVATYALTALAKLSTRLPDHLPVITAELESSFNHYKQLKWFELYDRARELMKIVNNEKVRRIALEPIKRESIECGISTEDSLLFDSVNSLVDIDSTTINTLAQSPDLALNHLNVWVEQSQSTSPATLQLQLYFTSSTVQLIDNISIALAVPRGFDFDYLAPASSTELSNDTDRISLSVLIKRTPSPKKESMDLLDFSDDAIKEVPVDWNKDCTLKIKVNYQIDEKSYQHIGQLPKLK